MYFARNYTRNTFYFKDAILMQIESDFSILGKFRAACHMKNIKIPFIYKK